MSKSEKQTKIILENLKQTPIVEFACKKAGISRATLYRWKKKSKEFSDAIDEATITGESFITDMSESQLISLVKDKNFQAIQLWLKHHHPKYTNKLEITGDIKTTREPTEEEKEIIRTTLNLANIALNKNNNGKQ